MLRFVNSFRDVLFTLPGGRGRESWCVGLSVSLVVHTGLLVLLACWHFELLGENGVGTVNSVWSGEVVSDTPVFTEIALNAVVKDEDAGARSVRLAVEAGWSRTSSEATSVPRMRDTFSEIAEEISLAGGLMNDVGEVRGGSKRLGSGYGIGDGSGDGGDEGQSFFGLRGEGSRYVYVVDSSRSMNHPHASEMKTRFGRLKLELVKSIMKLNASNEFYIVYFNRRAIPMPSRKMQPALPDVRKHFLEWAIKIRADGETDPRGALRMALKLNPDVIYFLTDGVFEEKVVRSLRKISQEETVIHTFAFGNRESEYVLRNLAAANSGKFHFVP